MLNATQRNATQRNATQRNATQRNANIITRKRRACPDKNANSRKFFCPLALLLAGIAFSAPAFQAHAFEAPAFQAHAHPEAARRRGSLYLYAAGSFFHTPRLFQEFIDPRPGFRGAVGYELRRFHFALESGFTRVDGTNPLVLSIELVPVVFRAGYTLPLRWGFSLQGNIGAGVVFSGVAHYENAIAMLTGNLQTSRARTPIAGARLFLTYDLPLNLRLHLGGGLDALFESESPIPMPFIEAGVSFRPFAACRARQRPAEARAAEICQAEFAICAPAHAPAYAPAPEERDIPEEPPAPEDPPIAERAPIERALSAARFYPDGAILAERYRPALREAGERLRENPELRVALRGHAAPFGDRAALEALSLARALYVRDYLVSRHGICEGRITVEFFGMGGAPELADETWESRRAVELEIECGNWQGE